MSARRSGSFLVVGLLAAGMSPSPAGAHAFPQRMDPRAGARLAAAPRQVRIWFDEALQAGMCRLEVQAGDRPVTAGPCAVDPAEPRLLAVPIARLASGSYQVRWRVMAEDGHATRGMYRFIVK